MNNKTIITIEFGFCIIWRIMEILECVSRKKKTKASVYILKPSVSVDNTFLDLHNSSDDTQTLKYLSQAYTCTLIYCQ